MSCVVTQQCGSRIGRCRKLFYETKNLKQFCSIVLTIKSLPSNNVYKTFDFVRTVYHFTPLLVLRIICKGLHTILELSYPTDSRRYLRNALHPYCPATRLSNIPVRLCCVGSLDTDLNSRDSDIGSHKAIRAILIKCQF
jgi:hypothetical protein